jgi:hypothetical protein
MESYAKMADGNGSIDLLDMEEFLRDYSSGS